MRTIGCISLFMLVGFCVSETFAQSSTVDFSVFDMGFDISQSANTTVISVVGQQTADAIEERNTRVEGGLLNTVLLLGILITAQPESATAGHPVVVRFMLPQNVQTLAATLFYRRGGESGFSAISLDDSLRGTIPASAVSIRGIEYFFVAARSPQGSIRFPSAGFETIRVRVETQVSSLTFQPRVYKMVSVPIQLDDASVTGVLADDYGPYNTSHWRVFRWENGDNVEYPAISATFSPGAAFWLITDGGNNFDVDNGLSVSSLQPYAIRLDTGWNQIANPFAFPVDSVANTDMVTPPYYYDGTEYVMDIHVLEPWEGYFVYNESSGPVMISVLPHEANQPFAKAASAMFVHGDNEYQLQLSASIPGAKYKDTYNYVGFLEHATVGKDRSDYPEPPPIGDYIQLSIIDGQGRYASNFKPVPKDGQQWDLQLTSTLDHPSVNVRMRQTGRLQDGFHVYVLDKDDFNAVGVSDNQFSIQLEGKGTVRRLMVIIGTEQYARDHSNGIPLAPIEYALGQNYPNPFNPTTTITYQLKKRSEVNLEIYNLLGQRVRTLVDAEQVTGAYSVVWDGRNNSGLSAATGVYVYRVRAGEFTASKKLLILR